MTSPRNANPDAVIQQLLSAAGKTPRQPRPEDAEAQDYSFDRPSRFTRIQLDRLALFAGGAAEAVARKLGQLLQTPVTLTPGQWQQVFAGPLKLSPPATLRHVLVIADAQGQAVGWVGISDVCAMKWLTRLLGGCEVEPAEPAEDDEVRELSDLERDLLTDLAGGIVEALAEPAGRFGCAGLKAGSKLSPWPDACGADDAEETCLLELGADDDAPAGVAIVLTSRAAALLAGEIPAALAETNSSPAMLPHVERTAVEACAMLSTSLAMRDVIALAAGDVLVLDQRIDEAVDVDVDGQTVMRAYPARQGGQMALQFAEFLPKKK